MKYYCVRQHDITDCGAACLATVAKQYGLSLPISRIREAAGTDRQGTNAHGVIEAARSLGFSVKGVKGDRESFFSEFPLPCIAHVLADGNYLHYVVIHKITKKKVVVADPAKGLVEVTPEELFGEGGKPGEPPAYRWTGVLLLLVPDYGFQKGRETKGLWSRFFHLLLPQKRLILPIFLASLLYTLFGILAAFYFKLLLDDILPGGLAKALTAFTLGVLGLNLFKVVLGAFRSHLFLYLSQKLDIALLLGYYRHVLRLPMNFFGTRRTGEIISRFTDASHVRDAISGATLTILIDTLMAAAGGAILYWQDGSMFAVTFLIVLFYGAVAVCFHKKYRSLNEEQMEDNAKLTSYMVESLNGIQTVKALNAGDEVEWETERRFVRLLKSIFHLSWVGNLRNCLVEFAELAGTVLILWVGARQVMRGRLTIGQLVTFYSLLAYFLDPVKNLIQLQPQMQTAVVAAQRLGEILELEQERERAESPKLKPRSLKGDLVMKNVTFQYGSREPVINGLTLHIRPGERVALVGESGSGKTTLARLLLRFYQPQSGTILIDGSHIEDWEPAALRERIAYVPQETFLFSGTILENLKLGLPDVEFEEIVEACRLVQADRFINELPLRYETRLEENGSNLSGGQRQRLALARAVLKKPDLFILDEATSNLDSITEQAVEQAIEACARGKTVLIIAHRLGTIRRCDRICVMEEGRILEEGSHEELLRAKGSYAGFWRRQTS